MARPRLKVRKRGMTIRLPIKFDRMLGVRAARMGISRSDLVEIAIRKLLKLAA